MIVTIKRRGDLFFNNDRTSSDQLSGLIRQQLGYGAEKRVYIRADARARYIYIQEVLDAIQSAGLQDVSFFTQ